MKFTLYVDTVLERERTISAEATLYASQGETQEKNTLSNVQCTGMGFWITWGKKKRNAWQNVGTLHCVQGYMGPVSPHTLARVGKVQVVSVKMIAAQKGLISPLRPVSFVYKGC